MDRRAYLASFAAATGVALAGCADDESERPPSDDSPDGPGWRWPESPTTGSPSTGRPPSTVAPRTPATVAAEWGFDEVVDVREAGVDPTGNRVVDDALAEHAADGALLFFPEGTYRFGADFTVADVSQIGMLGERATIVPPEGNDQVLVGLGYPDAVEDLLFEGFTFDYTAENTGGRPLYARGNGRVVVRDVTVRGDADTEADLLRVDVSDEDGSGLVERYVALDGAPQGSGVTGCEVGDESRGDITFLDCHVAGFPDNGLYARPPTGVVRVIGGEYRNNGVAGVRIQTAGRGIVRGVRVRCDDPHGPENMRGIRLRSGQNVLIDNCEVDVHAVSSSDGGVTFASALESATIQNTRINVDADEVNALRIKSSNSDSARSGPFRCENVHVTGEAAGGEAVYVADRNGCIFSDIRISQTGDSRNGLFAQNVEGSLQNAYISVTGDPLTLPGSRLTRQNIDIIRNRQG